MYLQKDMLYLSLFAKFFDEIYDLDLEIWPKQAENLGRSWQHTGLDSLSESSLKLHASNTQCQVIVQI
jgi:hypothetical protein